MKIKFFFFLLVISGLKNLTAQCTVSISPTNPTICSGNSVTLVANGNGGTLSWTPTAGLNTTTGSTVVASPTTTTTYTVIRTCPGGSDTANVTVTVNQLPLPTSNAGPDINFCSGTTGSIGASPVSGHTYSWTPATGLNNSSSANPTISLTNTTLNSTTSTYTLTTTETSTGCYSTDNVVVTVKPEPDASITDFNSTTAFTSCSGGNFSLTVTNISNTASTNTNYVIDWGDGSTNFTSSNWAFNATASHTYTTQGYFTLTLTVTGQNACVSTQTYSVFNGSNPSVGLGSPGGTVGVCVPSSLTFPITGTTGNPPGTIYILSTNTGAPADTFSHPPPANYTYLFSNTSCGASGGIISNAFYVRIQAENPCGFSVSTVEPITTSVQPQAGFSISPDTIACVNTTVTFTDTSVAGVIVDAQGVCNTVTQNNWLVSPASGWTVTSGSLGNANPNNNPSTWGSSSLGIDFSTPGTYNISQIVRNSCGNDTITRAVCIEPQPVPLFTLTDSVGCIPFNVNATNTSSTSLNNCIPPTYNWTVSYTSAYCDSVSSWGFTNSTNAASTDPSFVFNNAGTYIITLAVTNSCGTFTTDKTITVKKPPVATVSTSPTNNCTTPSTTAPTITAINCGTSALSYSWTFTGGIPASSTSQNPGSISFSSVGSHNISCAVTNECGTTTANTTFMINPSLTANAGTNISICTGDSAILNGAATGTASPFSYSWTSTPSGFTSPLQNPTVSPAVTTTYDLTITDANLCSATSQVIVTVAPQPTLTVNSPTICYGDTAVLNASGANTYNWTVNPTLSCTTCASPTAMPVSTTTYVVVGTSSAGCTDTTTSTVTVNPLPVVSAGPNVNLCDQPVAYTFTGSPAGGTWSGSPNITGSGVFTPNGTETSTLYYVYNDPVTGCQHTDSTTVTVAPPVIPTIIPSDSICANNTSVDLDSLLTSTPSGGTWSGTGVMGTTFSPSVAGTGVHTLTYSIGTGTCLASVTADITVNSAPVLSLSNQTICIGDSVTLNVTGAGTGGMYIWTPDPTLSCTNCALPTASPVSTTTYSVEGTNSSGCSSSITATVTVNPLPIVNAGPDVNLCDQPIAHTFTGMPSGGTWSGSPNITSSGVFTPNGTESSTLYYLYTDPLTGCQHTDSTLVTVAPPVIPTILSADSICANNPAVDLNSLLTSSPSGGTWSGTGVTGTTFNPSVAGNGIHTITYSIGTGTCVATVTSDITVNAVPVLSLNNPTICIGDSVTLTISGAGTGGTYIWTPDPTLSCSNCASTIASPVSSTTYTVEGTNSSGCSSSTTVTVTVNPLPVVNAGPDVNLCDQPITYTFTGTPSGGTWSGSSNITGSGVFTPNGTETSTLYYLYTDPTTGCQHTDSAIVTVLPPIIPTITPLDSICANNPAVDLDSMLTSSPAGGTWSGTGVTGTTFNPSVAGNGIHTITYSIGTGTCLATVTSDITVNAVPVLSVNNQTICIGDSTILTANGAGTGGIYIWTSDPTLSCTNCISTVANPVSTTTYTVEGTNSSGCSSSTTVTVTVNPLPVVNAGPDENLCDQPIPHTFTGTPSGGVWSGSSNITGSGVFTPNGTETSTLYYLYTDPTTGCQYTDSAIVTVLPPIIPTVTPLDSICANNPAVDLDSMLTSSPAGGTWSGTGVTGATFTPSTAGTGIHNVTYSIGTGTCLATASADITVNAIPIISSNSPTICIGDSITLNASGAGTGGMYIWTTDPTLSCTNCASTIASPTLTTTYTVQGTNSSGCSSSTTTSIIVNPLPVVNAGPDENLCDQPITHAFLGTPAGGTWSGSPNITSSGIFTPNGTETSTLYYLYTDPVTGCQNTDSTIVTVLPPIIPTVVALDSLCANSPAVNLDSLLSSSPTGGTWSGAGITGSIFTPSLAGTGTHTMTYTIGTGTCVVSVTADIKINSIPNLTPITPLTICNNTAVNINLTGNVPSSFIWLAQPTNTVDGEISSPQSSSVINNTLTNTSTSPQDVIYTITPTSVPQGCIGSDTNLTVTVMPDIVLSIPTNIEICSGNAVNVQLAANVPSNFSWFTTFDNPDVTGESITTNTGTLINDILVNNSSVNQVVIYSITPTSINGNCTGASQTISVTVKPPLELLNNDTVVICTGSSVNLPLVANTTVTFNWFAQQAVNVSGESLSSVTSPMITDTLVNNTTTVQQVIYNIIGTSTVNGCSSPSIPVYVFVNPEPFLSPPADLVACNNTLSQAVNFVSSVNNSSFTWSNSDTTVGLASNGIGNISSFTAINTGNTPVTATVIADVYFENAGVACPGNTQTFDVTVNPTPTVAKPPDQELCNDDMTTQVIFTGSVFGTTFDWNNDLPIIGIGASGTGNISSFNVTNGSTLTQIATISVIPNYTNNNLTCAGLVQNFTFTIHPSAVPTFSGVDICSNENVNLPITTSLPSTYTWQAINNTNVVGETLIPSTDSIITDTLINPGSGLEIVNYQIEFVTADFGCLSGPFSIPVRVFPLPDVHFTVLTSPLCNLDPIQFQNSTTGANAYLWDFGDSSVSTLINPTNTYQYPGIYDISLTATNTTTGCTDSITLPMNIQESPTVNFNVSTAQGCVLLDVVFTDIVNAPNTTLLWDFGDGETSNQPNLVDHQYIEPGCYDVSLTITNAEGCNTSLTQNDMVCAYPQPIANFTATPDSITFYNSQIEFSNLSLNAYTYIWDFGDGQTSVATNPIHNYTSNLDWYLVTLRAENQIGCYDSAFMKITANGDIVLYVPNVITIDHNNLNEVFLPIFNPGADIRDYKLLIYNRWGEELFESNDPDVGWDGTYQGTISQDGVYVWKIVYTEIGNSEADILYGHVTLLK